MLIPRFKGRLIQDEKGWGWECLILPDVDAEEGVAFKSKIYFDKKEHATENLKEFIKMSMADISEMFPSLGILPNDYYDVKAHEFRKWDKSDEH